MFENFSTAVAAEAAASPLAGVHSQGGLFDGELPAIGLILLTLGWVGWMGWRRIKAASNGSGRLA